MTLCTAAYIAATKNKGKVQKKLSEFRRKSRVTITVTVTLLKTGHKPSQQKEKKIQKERKKIGGFVVRANATFSLKGAVKL